MINILYILKWQLLICAILYYYILDENGNYLRHQLINYINNRAPIL